MAEENPIAPLHPSFANWYAEVAVGDAVERRQARWRAVKLLLSKADRSLVEGLVRLAFKTKQSPSADVVQRFTAAFQEMDEAFAWDGHAREIQILAGILLALLMEEGGDEAATCAIAVLTTASLNARRADVPPDLVGLAQRASQVMAEAARKRPDLVGMASVDVSKLDFSKPAAKVKETNNWEAVAEAFTLAGEVTKAYVQRLASRQRDIIWKVSDFIAIQDEELQMLWWLTGRHCTALDCAFESIPSAAQPLMLACELAAMTTVLPGPASVKGLLSRAGLSERKKLRLPEIVNATDDAWLQRTFDDVVPSPVTMPLHFAIKRQMETGKGEAWVAGWAATTGLDAARQASSLAWGELFYQERLLALQDPS